MATTLMLKKFKTTIYPINTYSTGYKIGHTNFNVKTEP